MTTSRKFVVGAAAQRFATKVNPTMTRQSGFIGFTLTKRLLRVHAANADNWMGAVHFVLDPIALEETQVAAAVALASENVDVAIAIPVQCVRAGNHLR